MSRRYFRSYLVVLFFALLCCSAALGDVTGSILGVVRDKSDAVVAGARVTAVNVDTNLTKETMSDADGTYRILALPPGPYRIVVSASGFQQFTATGIDVKVNDQLRIDVTLEVGAVQQNVSVEANAVQVETENTQLGDVIETQKMLAMPLNGRSYLDLLGLQAGVAPTTSGTVNNDRPVSGMFGTPGNVSVNGMPETANAFLVNGGDVSEGKNMGAGLVPNLDSIEEFRLLTNSFTAEYGRFSGGVMNAITKTGTNGFHGDVFEFLRNDKLDARGFFDPDKPELRRNQFGYAAGGPFWKNKLFWFTDYQGTKQVEGASTGILQLPNVNERQGIFTSSDFLSPNGTPMTVNGSHWANVLSQRLGYGVSNGEPYNFAGCTNTGGCVFPNAVIPQNGWDKVATNEIGYIPMPNVDPATGLYANSSQKGTVDDKKLGERVDFVNEKTGTWSFYYHYDDSLVYSPLAAWGNASNISVPGFPVSTPERAQMASVSDTKTFNPTTVNEFRISFFRTSLQTANLGDKSAETVSLSSLGYTTGLNTLGINPSGPAGYPETLPPTSFNNFSLGVNWLNMHQSNNTWHFADGFSKILGKHNVKIGGEFRYYQLNVRNVCGPNGVFNFNGSETGNDFADFLIGAPATYVQCSIQVLDNRSHYGGVYVQDSWKVKSNLTFNLGLRYEISQPWYDARGDIETINPGEQSKTFPSAPLGLVVPGDAGVSKSISPMQYKWAPRIGLAYSPDISGGLLGKILGGPGKTSIRAAYGIYYLSPADSGNFGVIGDAPYGLYWASTAPPMLDTPFQTRSDGTSQGQRFPFTFPAPGDTNLNFAQYLPLWEPGYNIHNKLSYAEHYNFALQRELSKAMVTTFAFVGTQGHHLQTGVSPNVGSAALCNQLNAEGATPQCGPYGETNNYTLPDGSIVYGTMIGLDNQALGPKYGIAAYAPSTSMSNVANSNYNAFQATLERRASDVTFLLAYTFSKSIDDANPIGQGLNPYSYAIDRTLSPFDLTNNFVASYNWAIPFQRAFTHGYKRLTEGWNVSGISRFSTGFPVTISQSVDLSLTNLGIDRPNVSGPVVTQDPHNNGPNGPNTYFLPGTFSSEAYGAVGDSPLRFFHGPGICNTDFGLSKTTKITESKSFLIRAEFFNIFNHTQFKNVVGNYSSSQFGLVTGARDPRIGQISAKFIW